VSDQRGSLSYLLRATCFVALAAVVPAQTTWTGNDDTDWNNPLNWTAGVPHAGLAATIPQGTDDPDTNGAGALACLSLVMHGGTELRVAAGDSLTIVGAFDMGGDVDNDGVVTVGGDFSGSGSMTGGGTFALVGGSGATWSGATDVDQPMTIAKTGGAVVTLDGNVDAATFTLQSGVFVVSAQQNKRLTVTGAATFAGGELTTLETGRLELLGAVTFSGTVCTSTPDIRCYANWTSDAAYAPTNGVPVTFNGVGVQTVAGSVVLPGATVATTSTVVIAGPTVLAGPTIVNGALDSSSGLLDVDGAMDVKLGGTWVLGAGEQTVGGDLKVSGALAGAATLVFDGATDALWTGPVAAPNAARVAKAPGAQVTIGGDVGVAAFALQSGVLVASETNGHTLTVAGDAHFDGGELTVLNVGTIVVQGDVFFAGASCVATPEFLCFGDWTSDGGYAPTNDAAVTFAGTAAQTASGSLDFASLVVAAGATLVAAAPVFVALDLTVVGTFDSSAHTAAVGGQSAVDGLWQIGTIDHFLSGDLKGTGAVAGGGRLYFVGAAPATWEGPPTVGAEGVVAKAPGGALRLGGVLTADALSHTAGTFLVADNASDVLHVLGDAFFLGGVLGTANLGTLDVHGNVVFAGTVCAVSPHFVVGGDWTGAVGYAPSAGGVATFVAGVVHHVFGVANFPGLAVPATSTVLMPAGTTTIALAATVDGLLDTTGGPTDANGAFALGGVWESGTWPKSVAGALSGTGLLNGAGPLTLDGFAGFVWSGPAAYAGPVTVAKASTNPVSVGAALVVHGFTLAAGALVVGTTLPATLSVVGDATFTGGTLASTLSLGAALGTVTAAGDVTFAGAACAVAPHLDCGGNWSSTAAFAATQGGAVRLLSAAPATFETVPSGAAFRAPALVFGGSAPTTLVSDATVRTPSWSILAGASFDVDGRTWAVHDPAGPTVASVAGGLRVGPGGALRLGPNVAATVTTAGALTLAGSAAARATLDGDAVAGGGYAISVAGALSARNCDIRRPGSAGFVLAASATLAAAPDDLSGATFDFPSTAPGARLFALERTAPASFRYVAFKNSAGVVGATNVAVAAGAPVSFTNWFGDLAGPAFESDPVGLVAWNPPDGATLASFATHSGVGRATVAWRAATLTDAVGFVLERSDGVGAPVVVVETPTVDTAERFATDEGIAAGTTYAYALSARLDFGGLWPLASGVATPFSAADPTNVLTVGAEGAFATIGAAVAAAPPFAVVRVAPGTYPSFVVGAVPLGGLRILADGPGVVVDTTTGPIVVENLPAGAAFELSGVEVGTPTTAQGALLVRDCAGPVVVDSCAFAAASGATAVRALNAWGFALQRSDVVGGASFEGATVAAFSAGACDALTLSGGAYVQTCGLSVGASTVVGAATREDYPGDAVDLSAPRFVPLATPAAFDVAGFAAAPWSLFAAFGSAYVAFPASPFEMPVLLDLGAAFPFLEGVADANGFATTTFVMPGAAFLLGFELQLQAVSLDLGLGRARLSNVATVVAVP
jgi:fibronectin-binding autotransporter adhesin